MASAAGGEPRREAPRAPAWLDHYEPRVPSATVDPDDASSRAPGAFSALGKTQVAADVADALAYEAARVPETTSAAPTDVVTHDWDDILARLASASDRLDAAVGLEPSPPVEHSPSPIAPPLALAPEPEPARTSPSTPRALVVAPAVASTASPRGGGRSGVAGSAPSDPPRLSEMASEVPMLMMISLEPGRSREQLRGDREAVRACLDDFYLELQRRLYENENESQSRPAERRRRRESDVPSSPALAARQLRAARESFREVDDEVRSASIPVEMEDESSRRYARIENLRKLLEAS
jgi:hypothetical protein